MIICEACGCPVDPDFLQVHSDWHDDLLTRSELHRNQLANPNRTRNLPETTVQDC